MGYYYTLAGQLYGSFIARLVCMSFEVDLITRCEIMKFGWVLRYLL